MPALGSDAARPSFAIDAEHTFQNLRCGLDAIGTDRPTIHSARRCLTGNRAVAIRKPPGKLSYECPGLYCWHRCAVLQSQENDSGGDCSTGALSTAGMGRTLFPHLPASIRTVGHRSSISLESNVRLP